MLDVIKEIDLNVFLFLNSFHNDFFDFLMLNISYNVLTFIILLFFLCFLGFKELKKKFFIAFIFLLISFGLSDLISTRVFKDNTKRLRPCHELSLKDKVHLAGQKCGGGKYGFVSSHASNSFAIIAFFVLLIGARFTFLKYFYCYAALISYSRVYLARHYPLDIICGAILGLICAYIGFRAYQFFLNSRESNSHQQ